MEREFLDVAGRAPAILHGVQDAFHPAEAAPAGSAPAAGFLGEEVLEIPQHADRTSVVVEDDHGASPHAAADFLDRGEIHLHVKMLLDQEIGGGAAREQAAELQSLAHAARVLLEDLAGRGAHRQLPQARPADLAAHAIELGARVLAAAQSLEPGRAMGEDVRNVRQGLHVVDDRGPAPESDHRGEGRLRARVGALALERVEQTGLLTAHVPAGAEVQVQLQVEPRSQDVPAEVTRLVGLRDGPGDPPRRQLVFPAKEHVGDDRPGSHRRRSSSPLAAGGGRLPAGNGP